MCCDTRVFSGSRVLDLINKVIRKNLPAQLSLKPAPPNPLLVPKKDRE